MFGLGNVPALSEAKGRAMWTKFGAEGTTNPSTADNSSVWQQFLSGLNAATGYIPPAASVTGAGLLGLSGHPLLGSITGLLSHDLKGIWNNPGTKDKLLAAIWPAAGLAAPWLAYALRQLFSKDTEKKGEETPTTTGWQDAIDKWIKGLHDWWKINVPGMEIEEALRSIPVSVAGAAGLAGHPILGSITGLASQAPWLEKIFTAHGWQNKLQASTLPLAGLALPWLGYGIHYGLRKLFSGNKEETKSGFDLSSLPRHSLLGWNGAPTHPGSIWTKFAADEGPTAAPAAPNSETAPSPDSGWLKLLSSSLADAAVTAGAGWLGWKDHPIWGSIIGALAHDLSGIWEGKGLKDKLLAAGWPAVGLAVPWATYVLKKWLSKKENEKQGASEGETASGPVTNQNPTGEDTNISLLKDLFYFLASERFMRTIPIGATALHGLSGHPIAGSILGVATQAPWLSKIFTEPNWQGKLRESAYPLAGLALPWVFYGLRKLFSKKEKEKENDFDIPNMSMRKVSGELTESTDKTEPTGKSDEEHMENMPWYELLRHLFQHGVQHAILESGLELPKIGSYQRIPSLLAPWSLLRDKTACMMDNHSGPSLAHLLPLLLGHLQGAEAQEADEEAAEDRDDNEEEEEKETKRTKEGSRYNG